MKPLPPSIARETMLKELHGQLGLVERGIRDLATQRAHLEGQEEALRTLIARLGAGLVNLDSGEVHY
jgi:hypothetical protein